MNRIVLNIPHSGITIPDWALCDIIIPNEELEALIEFMTDKDINKMWDFVPLYSRQVASISRLILDTERYRNDEEEEMATKGMGLYYTHTPNGKPFRNKSLKAYIKCLSLYDEYHSSLENKVTNALLKYNTCLLLDCHSFHDQMNYTGFDTNLFPDICIGVNSQLSNDAKYIVDTFKRYGYSVEINKPFSGSLVPLRYIDDSRVDSVMIELNRRIYDNSNFSRIQAICKEIYDKLQSSI